MNIWSSEIKELNQIYQSVKGTLPQLEKELGKLITTDDENMLLVYSRRCLEVIITDLCKIELKRHRGTEPLQRIIDKLNKDEIVPHNIIVSMQGVNSMSTFGAHPKEFETEQVKPVLSNLKTILKWYLKYFADKEPGVVESGASQQKKQVSSIKSKSKSAKRIGLISGLLMVAIVITIYFTNLFNIKEEGFFAKSDKIGSIIVLPISNFTGMDSLEWLIDGMQASLITNMGEISSLRIPGTTTSRTFKDSKKSIKEITSECNTDAALELDLICMGEDSICVQTRLITGNKEEQIWSADYRVARNQISNWNNIVTKQIAEEINIELTPEQEKLLNKSLTDYGEAYEAYLKGQYFLNKFTAPDLDSAMHYFERAKEIDADYALAYTGISNVWTYRCQWGLVSPAETNMKAMEAIMKAYALDSNNAEVQLALAARKDAGMFDWVATEAAYKKTISLNPSNVRAHAFYSHLLLRLGRTEEALEQIDIALKLDPKNPLIFTFYGVDLMLARKYDESVRAFNDAYSLSPGYPFASANLWQVYYMVGQTEEAYNTLKSFWSLVNTEAIKSLEQGYLKDGPEGAFLSLAERLGEIWENDQNQFFAPTDIAMLYSAGHNTEKSIYWLEKAYMHKDPNLPYLLIPIYDNVRNDPRFKDISRKINIPLHRKA